MSIKQVNDLVSTIMCYILNEGYTSKASFVKHITEDLHLPQEVVEHVTYLICDSVDVNTGANLFPIK